ncbi:hypothetical protein F5890DRAFT_807692 [Lentinula detonsa]|uniref:Proteophosphoglycan ppg4 n=1 Tax=Lentinula detonsa TaxID=2804962 RepID=A0AA38PRI8_9AGAR|nr:hypothetical protein F5890DRAFT_807692 [Lentinula detonsa]
MFLFSRSRSRSRQPTPEHNGHSTGDAESPVDNGDSSERPVSHSPAGMSRDSEGYPTWLPKRPPPPAPASTFASSVGGHEPIPAPTPSPMPGGRRPTPRSVRIVSLEQREAEKAREQTDHTRVPSNHRVWSRATGSAFTPTAFSPDPYLPKLPAPRFRSRGVNFDLMCNPSLKSKLYFYISYVLLFAHIPLQTFFDFNAVFILIEVSKYPNPKAPGVPGSGKNWALGAAAYIACWLVWILVVCIVYELVYSFIRRWRTKRPAIYPIYLSSPAFTFASLTSYSNFCFLQHLRYSAFFGEHGGIRDGLTETFWFYSQNLPTVALLLPRAGLSLALLFSFSSGNTSIAGAGISPRDATFFRDDGALTDYARGVLIANAAWTAWKILVLFASWVGLWIVSGQGCAGLCGPRYRWEEEDAEKTITSIYSIDDLSESEQPLPWLWKENTRMRILDAYDFCCVTARPLSGRWGHHKKLSDMSDLLGTAYPLPMPESPGGFEGMDRLMAAVGLPSESLIQQPRRGILSDELFKQPEAGPSAIRGRYEEPADLAAIIPKVVQRTSKERDVPLPSAPLMKLPYPFTTSGAQVSSDDEKIPFPPSPSVLSFKESSSGTKSRSKDNGTTEEEEEGEVEEVVEGDEEEEEVASGAQTTSEDPSSSSGSGRASNSMSSLGHPVSSRYPFQFRHPTRGASYSSGVPSHATPPSNGHSIASRFSQNTRSTGNRESVDSHSPRSHYTSGSDAASPISMSGLPMPPRHPQQYQGRGRARAGTVPVPSVQSSPSIDFPRRARVRGRNSDPYHTSEPEPALWSSDLEHEDDLEDDSRIEDSRIEDSIMDSRIEDSIMEQPEPEGSQEAAEGEDVVGLLSPSGVPSPRTSFSALRHRASTLSSHHHRSSGAGSGSGSRSGSNSRTNSHSGSSSGSRSRAGSMSVVMSVRSRAQSLMQNVSSASRSSLELVQDAMRSRANSSMARLEEDSPYYSDRTHSRSASGSDGLMSSQENYTFGQRLPFRAHRDQVEEEARNTQSFSPPSQTTDPELREMQSNQSLAAPSLFAPSEAAPPSLHPSESTMHQELRNEPSGLMIPGAQRPTGLETLSEQSSPPDISTAAASFVTAPVTVDGSTTDESGRTPSSWGGITHMVDRSDGTWRPA